MTEALLERLTDIERALQRGDCTTARWRLFEAEDLVLQIKREMIVPETKKIR